MIHHIFLGRSFNRFYDLICLQNINNWRLSIPMSIKGEFRSLRYIYQVGLLLTFLLALPSGTFAQKDTLGFFDYPASLHRGRFWTASSAGVIAYTGTLITLNELWYKQYPRTSFHFFDDAAEWQQMDKAGHMFTAYFEADWLYNLSRWR